MKTKTLIAIIVAFAMVLGAGTFAWGANGNQGGKPPEDPEDPPATPIDGYYFWRLGHMDGPHDSSKALGISRDGKVIADGIAGDLRSYLDKQVPQKGKVNYVKRPDGRRAKISEDNKKEVSENIAPEWIVDTFLATVRQVCTDQPYRPRAGRYSDWEGPFPDYLEFVIDEATQHGWTAREACDAWGSGAYLLESVPSLLWILFRHAQEPEEAIVRAVNDTQDNDTIAAIAGAAVGALHGVGALPARWTTGLLGRTRTADDGRVFQLVEAATRQAWD